MSFSLFRASVRKVATAGSLPRAQLRNQLRISIRKFSTPPPEAPAPKSNTTLYVGIGAVVAAAGAAFYSFSDSGTNAVKSGVQVAKVKTNFVPTKEDYQKVYNKIAGIFDDAGDYDAWHSSGTYDKESKTGGSNYATMRFAPESQHGANAGLDVARDLMENIKKEFPWISYGDLWTLGAQATPDGRLPDASQGADHLRKEIVALSGGHAVGRCHSNRSGFDGPWTFSPTTMTNDFFKLLFDEKWVWKKWNGPKQLEDKGTKSLMMLPAPLFNNTRILHSTDYVLVTDKIYKKYARAYADDEALFFKDFSAVCAKLFELGVPTEQWVTPEPWIMKNVDEK
ncbi:hypothetical protein HHX47_DHR3000049 [Lentinula edodes]|nr:hypothetical protein HHX47_DHR3000049 [Lentinula edodes]